MGELERHLEGQVGISCATLAVKIERTKRQAMRHTARGCEYRKLVDDNAEAHVVDAWQVGAPVVGDQMPVALVNLCDGRKRERIGDVSLLVPVVP